MKPTKGRRPSLHRKTVLLSFLSICMGLAAVPALAQTTGYTGIYRDTYTGGRDSRTFYLYNYKFSLNNTKTVQSITLPNNSNVQVMAMTVVQ